MKKPISLQAPGTANNDHNSAQLCNFLLLKAAVASDDSSSQSCPLSDPSERANGNGPHGYTQLENRVRISLNSYSKVDIRELRQRLINELDQVRGLVKRLEASMEFQQSGGTHSQFSANYVTKKAGSTMRVNSEVGSAGHRDSTSAKGLSKENSHGVGDFVEKQKRTPKGNQPKRDSNKKSKTKGGKGDDHEKRFGQSKDKYSSQLFKSCGNVLEKLMKHKFGWVFNVPVDVKGLGLLDYNAIIKHPMDLGTVKTRLNKTYYKSPMEFAEDVRLTFHNAMLYNPKGQDVHAMAEQLLKIFEERWAAIEKEYNLNRTDEIDDADLPRPTSRKVKAPARKPVLPTPSSSSPPSASAMRTLDRAESVTKPVDPNLVAESFDHGVSKKPKAKDPDKRDMSYEEKQRLSTSLQNLPSEKLDNVVQIIKKRTPGLSQQEDEIEVDIASLEPETLWELDRFVTNYKKSLSKNKRKAEVAFQSRPDTGHATEKVRPRKPSLLDMNRFNISFVSDLFLIFTEEFCLTHDLSDYFCRI